MRLGQLARKLGITQSEITNFLESNGFKKIEGSNTKVPDNQEKLTIAHFAPEFNLEESESNLDLVQAEIADLPQEIHTDVSFDVSNSPEQNDELGLTDTQFEIIHEPEPEAIEEQKETLSDLANSNSEDEQREDSEEEDVEVIRVKKIKLEGIKVVGKIDLPEPKPKKEEETDESKDNSLTEKTSDDTKRRNKQFGRNKSKRPTRRETYEQRVNREKKEEERKLEKQHRALKRKKKQYYVENIQSRTQPKPPKKKTRKHQLSSDKTNQQATKPKNPISRFWGWINGKYDQF